MKTTNIRKIKYVIIAGDNGQIYGAFKPAEIDKANVYLKKILKDTLDAKIYHVSNLNQFLSKLKYDKRNQTKTEIRS